jgi:hypothetical protein
MAREQAASRLRHRWRLTRLPADPGPLTSVPLLRSQRIEFTTVLVAFGANVLIAAAKSAAAAVTGSASLVASGAFVGRPATRSS